MKQTTRILQIAILALAFSAATAGLFASSAFAQDQAAFIGVLDREFVYKKSRAGSGLLGALSTALKKLDDEATAAGKKFREEEKKINGECKTISEDECKEKVKAFSNKVKATEDDQNKKRKALEKQRDDGRDKITKALEPIITKIIADRELLIVIDRAALVYAAESLDITEEALKALDAKLPKI